MNCATHPTYKLDLNSTIFSLENDSHHEDLMMASLFVFACFLAVMAESLQMKAYTQGEEPIISLNMALRIVVVITNRAVITGITVSLTSITWRWFGSLSR